MNQPLSAEDLKDIQEELFDGRKIGAIKLYRKYCGAGLKEAKDAVEKIEAELRQTAPDRFKPSPPAKGCLGAVAIVVTLAVAILACL